MHSDSKVKYDSMISPIPLLSPPLLHILVLMEHIVLLVVVFGHVTGVDFSKCRVGVISLDTRIEISLL